MRLINTSTDAKILETSHKPNLFSGDQPLGVQLINDPIQNFNVIYGLTKAKSIVRF